MSVAILALALSDQIAFNEHMKKEVEIVLFSFFHIPLIVLFRLQHTVILVIVSQSYNFSF